MKKLFVLFLLVALVPFTVGCSLWGGDDEAVTYPTALTIPVTVPAAGFSLRAAPATDWTQYSMTVEVGGTVVNLEPISYANGVITFRAFTSTAIVNAVQAGTAPVTVAITGAQGGVTSIVIEAGVAGSIEITVTALGVVSVTVNNAPLAADKFVSGTGFFAVNTVKFGAEALGTSATGAKVVNTLTPTFVVDFTDYTVVQADIDNDVFYVTAKSVTGAPAIELDKDMFTLTIVDGDLSVAVKDGAKKLTSGKTYQVNIITAKNSENKLLTKATYYFTVTL